MIMNKIYNRRDFMKFSTHSITYDTDSSGNSFPKEASMQTRTDGKPIRLGFVGIGNRGAYHLTTALSIEGVEIPALCEVQPDRLYQAKRWVEAAGLPTPRLYGNGPTDYLRLCQDEDLDAIICVTPWQYHTPVCLAAMRSNKHAVSEVPIVITLDEAWDLIETYESTGKWATIGLEGMGDSSLLRMIQKGMLGEIVHAETGYVHDLRQVKFDPGHEPWRIQHSLDRNGNLYPDHPMAKILPATDINHGDRIDYLVSMSSSSVMLNDFAGVNYGKDSFYAKSKFALGDYNATLMRTVNGKMITLNHDTSTPHPREDFRLQGTKGIYLSDDVGKRIYLEGVSPEEHTWEPADKYLAANRPPVKPDLPLRKGVKLIGEGYYSSDNKPDKGLITQIPSNWQSLISALREKRLPVWDVYDSITSSAISPLTEISVADKCKPVDFPDFTKGKWKTSPRITLG